MKKWKIKLEVSGVSKADIAELKGIVKAFCKEKKDKGNSGVVSTFDEPSPTCGAPGDPCRG